MILVPPSATAGTVEHIAIAWDESRVAARALHDALNGTGLAQTLVASLDLRGYEAKVVDLTLDGSNIATALQDAALAEGVQLLAMGGFGHSRLRDFILGGATKGVLTDLRMPVLLAH